MGIEGLLTSRATIKRVTVGDNTGPHPTRTWANNETDVPCRVQQRSGDELNGPLTVGVATHLVFFAYGTDVTAEDRIVVGSDTYHIDTVDKDPGDAQSHMEALCHEVRADG